MPCSDDFATVREAKRVLSSNERAFVCMGLDEAYDATALAGLVEGLPPNCLVAAVCIPGKADAVTREPDADDTSQHDSTAAPPKRRKSDQQRGWVALTVTGCNTNSK